MKANANDNGVTAQAWLRAEWDRTGLPLREANEACGVKNMVSRRHLIRDHRWYRPPGEVVAKLAPLVKAFLAEQA